MPGDNYGEVTQLSPGRKCSIDPRQLQGSAAEHRAITGYPQSNVGVRNRPGSADKALEEQKCMPYSRDDCWAPPTPHKCNEEEGATAQGMLKTEWSSTHRGE
ncbi:hypothetical protein NDU88_002270 [Pleurodeles waltl]|uniref:Prolactin receptor n=1 Tax=Pleurodeles waltl TaxID=8319 RepID=A0AAV7U973_PLEWA|nr:hypothetical protein NDU88_002270 [Pleurodeles waltl]